MEKHVANTFNRDTSRDWNKAWDGAENIKDFKTTARNFIEERIDEWKTVLDMVEALPNDEKQEYTVDEDDTVVME